MANSNEPVLLELAHLPREQVGPFLLLGLDKDASKEDIEANWAERIKWARKQQTTITLEEINWARDLINDVTRRMASDATTLNFDTIDGTLANLAQKHGMSRSGATVSWEPMDEEKPLADYTPAVDMPDIEQVRAGLIVPEIPRRFPAATVLLKEMAGTALDPWSITL